jgi:hypothetical protein
MASDRRIVPQHGLRIRNAFGVELHGDRSRADASGEVPKDSPDYVGLGRINLAVSSDPISALVEPFDNAVSVAKPAAGLSILYPTSQAAVRLRSEVFQKQSIHGPF